MGRRIEYRQGQRMPGTRLTYDMELPKLNPKVRRARFICDCGTVIEKPIAWVAHLNTTSCGCYRSELVTETNTTHGQAVRRNQTGAYRSWQAMHQRAGIHPNYLNVSICARWSGDAGFEHFFEDMGPRPRGHSIERVNGQGDYEPSNCIWADDITQATNSKNTKFVNIGGVTDSINGWCRKYGLPYVTYKQRIRRGMSIIDAITTPIDTSKQRR